MKAYFLADRSGIYLLHHSQSRALRKPEGYVILAA